ncbi:MAG: recombination mediator RecR [Bacilli bacterium]|nr:recombination mediator RecR [Bacilli bacterium]MDD4809090.1 recombination mediator RecR [Bacilli bacterium]
MNYPTTIKNLIECYKKLPGIGEKTAERYALATIELEEEIIELFSKSLKNIKTKIRRCNKCNNLSENELCDICCDSSRDSKMICVVEQPKNVILFEKVGSYNGKYHVLDGLISPLDGINPEQIKLNLLIKRIKEEKIKEVIIAVKPSIEGETTALYIKKLLEGLDITVSKIAHGVPIGAEMEYIDSLTLEMALEDRKTISNNT